MNALNEGHSGKSDPKGKCEQCFSATLDLGGPILSTREDRVVAPDTGATANLL